VDARETLRRLARDEFGWPGMHFVDVANKEEVAGDVGPLDGEPALDDPDASGPFRFLITECDPEVPGRVGCRGAYVAIERLLRRDASGVWTVTAIERTTLGFPIGARQRVTLTYVPEGFELAEDRLSSFDPVIITDGEASPAVPTDCGASGYSHLQKFSNILDRPVGDVPPWAASFDVLGIFECPPEVAAEPPNAEREVEAITVRGRPGRLLSSAEGRFLIIEWIERDRLTIKVVGKNVPISELLKVAEELRVEG
jgi:hypothetical protein